MGHCYSDSDSEEKPTQKRAGYRLTDSAIMAVTRRLFLTLSALVALESLCCDECLSSGGGPSSISSSSGNRICSFTCIASWTCDDFQSAYDRCRNCTPAASSSSSESSASPVSSASPASSASSASSTSPASSASTLLASPTAPTTSPGPASNAVLLSKLPAFYDFRVSYANLATGYAPGAFALTPSSSVTRSAAGAAMTGSPSSYIDVNTQSQALLSMMQAASNFSFYVKAVRQTFYMATYQYLFDCSSPGSSYLAGLLGEQSGRLYFEHSVSPSSGKLVLTSAQTFANTDSNQNPVSLGVAIQSGTFKRLFGQSVVYTSASTSTQAYPYSPTCMRLGYHASDPNGLKGTLICYAFANWTLSAEEFAALHSRCS